jgi:hypothetical protein
MTYRYLPIISPVEEMNLMDLDFRTHHHEHLSGSLGKLINNLLDEVLVNDRIRLEF